MYATVLGDANGDCVVDMTDINYCNSLSGSYYSEQGGNNWDSRCDVNGDMQISIKDISFIISRNGNTC